MNTQTAHRCAPGSARGFTLTELMVAMTVTLAVTGAALSALLDANRATAAASALSDVNQTLRIAMNTLIRDLVQAGEGDYSLRTGVSIPNGDGVDAIVRPAPAGVSWFFPATYIALPAVSPSSGAGAVINGVATDVVTILFEDRTVNFAGVTPNIPASGATMVFPVGYDMTVFADGDLIRFGNGAMQEVTNVAGQTLHFQSAAGSNLNQRDAPQGSVMAMKGEEPTFPDLPISRIIMVTYYLRLGAGGVPQLVRRVNYGEERVVAIGVENLQFTWDLVNGADNPSNVDNFDEDTLEGQIRKANVYMAARSQNQASGQTMRTSLTTQVSLRSLAFVSRYDLQ